METDQNFVNLEGASILVVDDNPVNAQILGIILRKAGGGFSHAGSGWLAIEQLRLHRPDLILLDIKMPDMDGYTLCKRLKQIPSLKDIPIIFISSLSDPLDKVKAFKGGGMDYITKPFEKEEVLVRIDTHLKIARLQQRLEQEKAELLKINQELVRSREQTAEVFDAMSELLPGHILNDKYLINAKIGSGGFGVVYRATQIALERSVAIKVIRPHSGLSVQEQLLYFRREGISASRVFHPNAVTVFDAGVTPVGIAYLAMELLQGHTLKDELSQKGSLSLARGNQIVVPLCEVLAHAHAIGVIHCDIKPDNIYLHQGTAGEVVKVLDFGIARLLSKDTLIQAEPERPTGLLGTPAFIAPERWHGDAFNDRVDVYSMGVLLVLMLCGYAQLPLIQRPFTSRKEPSWKAGDLLALNPELPASIEAVVLKALHPEPAQRPSIQNFLQEWSNAFSLLPTVADADKNLLLPHPEEYCTPTITIEPTKKDPSGPRDPRP